MTDTFRIIHPNLKNHQIFKVQIDAKKISKLFDLQIKKKKKLMMEMVTVFIAYTIKKN